MTFDRRNFLQAGIGIGIGAAGGSLCHRGQAAQDDIPVDATDAPLSEYERILATSNLFDVLGRPRSWSVVQRGFLPISPERVLILEPKHLDGLANRWCDDQRRICERMREKMQRDAAAESLSCENGRRWQAAENGGVSPEKLGLILWLTNELTRYYAAPEWWEEWAYLMASREALGSTGVGRHFAIPHQYQYDVKNHAITSINTTNAGLDWWLVLIPGGTKHWEPLDDEPVYAMFTYVSAGLHSNAWIGEYLPILCHADRAVYLFTRGSPNALVELSRMDRVSAVRLVNRHFVWAADDCPQGREKGVLRPSRMKGDKETR